MGSKVWDRDLEFDHVIWVGVCIEHGIRIRDMGVKVWERDLEFDNVIWVGVCIERGVGIRDMGGASPRALTGVAHDCCFQVSGTRTYRTSRRRTGRARRDRPLRYLPLAPRLSRFFTTVGVYGLWPCIIASAPLPAMCTVCMVIAW